MSQWLLGLTTSDGLARLLRFGLAGALATLLYFVLVSVLVVLVGLQPVAASVWAYLLAMVFSYAAQSRFTFRVRTDGTSQVIRFVVTSLAGLGISYGAMWLTEHALEIPYVFGAAAVCVLIPLTNFFVFKHWVFAQQSESSFDSVPDGK